MVFTNVITIRNGTGRIIWEEEFSRHSPIYYNIFRDQRYESSYAKISLGFDASEGTPLLRNIMKVIVKRTTSKFVKTYVHKNTFSIFHYILLSFSPNNCPGLYTSRKIEITMYREKTILGFRMCNIW